MADERILALNPWRLPETLIFGIPTARFIGIYVIELRGEYHSN